MKSHPYHDLIARYTEGAASADEVSRLDAILESDPEARAWLLAWCNLDSALAAEAADARVGPRAVPPARPHLPWRPTAAALLAGICGAIVGAGAAWAVVPHAPSAARWSLLRCGFERPEEVRLRSESLPRTGPIPGFPGSWEADPVRIAGQEHGVRPFAGSRMLAFEKAVGATRFDGGLPHSCDIYQVVDLTHLRREIAAGDASLTLSARFRDASPPHEVPTLFELRVHIFNEPPDQVTDFSRARTALASNSMRTYGKDAETEAGWYRLAAGTTVPSDAVFAVVQISATLPREFAQGEPPSFDGHYCDDVELTFVPATTPGR